MKRYSIILISLVLLTGACQPNTPPTIDAAQVQASAVAVANTMAAQTQAAVPPTLAPTDTPLPSPTPIPSPTLSQLLPLTTDTPSSIDVPTEAPGQPSIPGTDPCNGPLTNKPKGAPDAGKIGTNIKIVNTTKAPITISLYLSKNKLGECGYKSYAMSPTSSIAVVNDLPFGCYFLSAFINDPKKPNKASFGPVCITGTDKTTISVLATSIKVTGP